MGLNHSQYQTIMRDYEQKQLKSHDILMQRYKEVYEACPDFQSLEDSISTLSVQYGKRLLDGEANAMDTLKKKLVHLRNMKKNMLTSAGFPPDYLEPIYVCPHCQDTGYINGQKCSCFKKAATALLYEQSQLKQLLQLENFNTFSLEYYSDNFRDPKSGKTSLSAIKESLQICKDFVASFHTQFKNLFLYGDVGTGKTFLSNCIAKELIESGFSVIYFSAPAFFNTLAKSVFDKDDTDSSEMQENIYSCDLLIIDDLGTEYINSFVVSQFFSCINNRITNQRSTIISTNLSLDALVDLYTERAFSRITSNYIMLKIFGDDIRIKKKLLNREDS